MKCVYDPRHKGGDLLLWAINQLVCGSPGFTSCWLGDENCVAQEDGPSLSRKHSAAQIHLFSPLPVTSGQSTFQKIYIYFYLVSLKIIEDTVRDQSDIKCHNPVDTVVIPQCWVYGYFKHRTQTKLWLFTSVTWWAQYDWLKNRVLLSKTKRVRKIRDEPDMVALTVSTETLWPTCSDILQHWTFAMQCLLAGRS